MSAESDDDRDGDDDGACADCASGRLKINSWRIWTTVIKKKISMIKLDRVDSVDNRPSIDRLPHLRRKIFNKTNNIYILVTSHI